MAIDTTVLTVLVGILGIFFGTLISPYINHRLTQKYNRREIFFKKKLEYFERITECLEKNIRLYKSSINKAEENSNIKELIEKIKKERKNFLISFSPIYFNAIKLSAHIKNFTKIERKIFIDFSNLSNVKNKEAVITDLKKQLSTLRESANKIILEIKKEIKRDI